MITSGIRLARDSMLAIGESLTSARKKIIQALTKIKLMETVILGGSKSSTDVQSPFELTFRKLELREITRDHWNH